MTPILPRIGVSGNPGAIQVSLGQNAVSIYQDLVEAHGFAHQYNSVKRFVGRLRARALERFDVLEFLPGEDYGKRRVMLSIRKRAGMLRRLLVGCRDGRLHIILREP